MCCVKTQLYLSIPAVLGRSKQLWLICISCGLTICVESPFILPVCDVFVTPSRKKKISLLCTYNVSRAARVLYSLISSSLFVIVQFLSRLKSSRIQHGVPESCLWHAFVHPAPFQIFSLNNRAVCFKFHNLYIAGLVDVGCSTLPRSLLLDEVCWRLITRWTFSFKWFSVRYTNKAVLRFEYCQWMTNEFSTLKCDVFCSCLRSSNPQKQYHSLVIKIILGEPKFGGSALYSQRLLSLMKVFNSFYSNFLNCSFCAQRLMLSLVKVLICDPAALILLSSSYFLQSLTLPFILSILTGSVYSRYVLSNLPNWNL